MEDGQTSLEVRPCQFCGVLEGEARLGMWICDACLDSAGGSCGGPD